MIKEMNKKAVSRRSVILITVIILVLAAGVLYHRTCKITVDETDYLKYKEIYDKNHTGYEKIYNDLWEDYQKWLEAYNNLSESEKNETNSPRKPIDVRDYNFRYSYYIRDLMGCEREYSGFADKSTSFIKDKLGFNETIWDFFYPGLVVGFFIWFWIWLVYKFAIWNIFLSPLAWMRKKNNLLRYRSGDLARLRTSWLAMIGDSLWKMLPVAAGYALLMQIPVINSFINIITLESLFNFGRTGWSFFFRSIFLKSIILSFYLGFLPAAIEEYGKYKLRKDYYERIVRVRYRQKMTDALSG